MKTLAFAEANVIATIGDLSNWFSNTCSSTRCVTIYDLEFSLSWPSETISRTVVMHEGELWLIWVFKKKTKQLYQDIVTSLASSIQSWTKRLLWLALGWRCRGAGSALDQPDLLLCVCMHSITRAFLWFPSTDEEIKTNGCSSGFWSVFWLPITLPGGIATLSVICLQCLLRVQSIFQKSAELLC